MHIYSIKFRAFGQASLYSSKDLFEEGAFVMVETEQGLSIGKVVRMIGMQDSESDAASLPEILHRASDEEIAAGSENDRLAAQAADFCKKCIENRHLDMKLVDVEVFFDRSKFIFYFTAPVRIDFRELVKELVREYRSRIELRQIGVRHETQMVGAVGNCGMVCCCRRYLRKFAPVTIRMAKEQNLFLNPSKISGICGRLLCCLSYEQDNYDAFHDICPRLGKKYHTNQGTMKILRANMFRNTVSVLTETGEEQEISLDDWQSLEPFRPESQPQNPAPSQQKQNRDGEHDGMLVVSVSPENLDDPYLFDEYTSLSPESFGEEENVDNLAPRRKHHR